MASPTGRDESGYINPASAYNYPSSNALGAAAQSWPPSRDFGPPNWATDNKNADAAYSPSPVFSPEIFTPENEGWNYFEPRFISESQIRSSANTTAASDLTQERFQVPNVACTPFPIVTTLLASMVQDEGDKSDQTNETNFLSNPFPSSKMGNGSPRNYQKPTWGKPINTQQSCKSVRDSSRNKRKPESSPRRKSFNSNSSNGHQLRGIRNRPQMEFEKGADEEESGSRRGSTSRVSHNMVEKQYRTRLNIQFTNLLEVIPQEVIGTQFAGDDDVGGRRGKVSKGDVLVLAKRYIQYLEQDKQSLERENKEHEQSISHLRAALSRN